MNLRKEHRDEDRHFDSPRKLVEDLRALFDVDIAVPPELDERILTMAQRRFARRRPRLLVLRWPAVATATVCVLVAIIVSFHEKQTGVTPPAQLALVSREDFDHNGQVDILDAFALARQIRDSDEEEEEWDINGDGLVNQKDVDVVALAAVSLERGTLQ